MTSFDSPILLDTNIILYFQDNLELLCKNFTNLLIHEYVYKEVLSGKVRDSIEKVYKKYDNITFVNDDYYDSLDDIELKLYKLSQDELNDTFNTDIEKDIGECKTLLYSKFNKTNVISTQDTIVWSFINIAKHFTEVHCMTIQDISILIRLNSTSKDDINVAKYLYNKYTRSEHKYVYFKKYVELHGNSLPAYIEFENLRIENFKHLISGYLEWSTGRGISDDKLKIIISNIAKNNCGTCLNCLFSRIDKSKIQMGNICSIDDPNNVVYNSRVCEFKYIFKDQKCESVKNEFDSIIKDRDEN